MDNIKDDDLVVKSVDKDSLVEYIKTVGSLLGIAACIGTVTILVCVSNMVIKVVLLLILFIFIILDWKYLMTSAKNIDNNKPVRLKLRYTIIPWIIYIACAIMITVKSLK